MESTKHDRLLEIFFRSLRGEDLSVQRLAEEYNVSTKSISRDINDLKSFLADHRQLVGNTELSYSSQGKCYRLHMDEFLTNKELFSMVEVMIGARAFSKEELLTLTDKLKRFTTAEDRPKLNDLIRKELYHYSEVKHDCDSVMDTLWKLVNCISDKREVTIEYYRIDRVWRTHRIRPASLMFTDHYFYLIAFKTDDDPSKPFYFRVDRTNTLLNTESISAQKKLAISMKGFCVSEAYLCGLANYAKFDLNIQGHLFRQFSTSCRPPKSLKDPAVNILSKQRSMVMG